MARHIENIEALKGLIGEHIGYSEYMTISQEQVNLFADATGDHQWIHIDVEKAKAGPFGGPIAHGYCCPRSSRSGGSPWASTTAPTRSVSCHPCPSGRASARA
jgi:acyl dehydratase